MKYAAKMLIDRKTGSVRLLASGKVPDSTESRRTYLSPGCTELLQVFSQRESLESALELATRVEGWRLETKEARYTELQKAIGRLDALQIPHTVLARMIDVPRISLDAYVRNWSAVPPRVLVKVQFAVDRLEKLNAEMRDTLPK